MATLNFSRIELRITNALKELRNGENSLYVIASGVVELFNAQDDYAAFLRQRHHEVGADGVVDYLNTTFLRDFAVDLSDLIVLLNHYPKREQWNRPLLDLLDEAHAKLKLDRSEQEERKPRASVKVSQYLEVVKRAEDAEYRANHADILIGELRGQIGELKTENAMLRGQIDELRRILGRRHELAGV